MDDNETIAYAVGRCIEDVEMLQYARSNPVGYVRSLGEDMSLSAQVIGRVRTEAVALASGGSVEFRKVRPDVGMGSVI